MLGPGGTMSGMYYDDAKGLRKKNRNWRLIQSYSPVVGWTLFTLLAVLSLYRQHNAKVLGQQFNSTMGELTSMKTQNVQLQSAATRKDSTIKTLNSKVDVIQRDLINTQKRFNEEKALLTKREAELLTAKAETMAAHKDLESRHAEVQQQHSDASGKATTCQQDLAQANKRVLELSNTLNVQYNIAAELRRNLEAEAALHTSNEGKWQAQEKDLRRQLAGLEDHHKDCMVEPANTTSQDSALTARASLSQTGTGDSKAAESAPKTDGLPQQQAHPGIAAAAMAAASNVASQFLARPSVNQTEVAGNSSTASGSNVNNRDDNSSSSSRSSSDMAQKRPGDTDIPWRQVAGLLHGQGITDPLGLEHMTTTLETFVGARLAIDKDRQEVPADLTAEDDALVNLLSGAGITDPQGRAHFVSALREHLLSTKTRPNTATTEEAIGSNKDVPSGGDANTGVVDAKSAEYASSNSADAVKSSQKAAPASHGHTHHGISSHGHRAFLVDDESSSGSDRKQQ